jgi:itaconyl-CoA hydratase
MVHTAKQVGEQRYRETFGRYFEDFEVGDVYEHRPGARSRRPTTPGSRC